MNKFRGAIMNKYRTMDDIDWLNRMKKFGDYLHSQAERVRQDEREFIKAEEMTIEESD